MQTPSFPMMRDLRDALTQLIPSWPAGGQAHPPRPGDLAGVIAPRPERWWAPVPAAPLDTSCHLAAAGDDALHVHEELQVLVANVPGTMVDGRGRCTPVPAGAACVTAPGVPHRFVAASRLPARVGVLLLALPAPAAEAGGDVPHGHHVDRDARLVAPLLRLFGGADDAPAPALAADELRAVAAAALGGGARVPDATPAPVRRVRELLRAHVARPFSLDELAAEACLSSFHLLRVFAREMGFTPHAYQMQLRLARARRLVARGVALSRVAYDAGFADQSHLTRRFRAAFGVTPGRYARLIAAGTPFHRAVLHFPGAGGELPDARPRVF